MAIVSKEFTIRYNIQFVNGSFRFGWRIRKEPIANDVRTIWTRLLRPRL